MALAVDRYELGQIGTNCYVVRAERGGAEAVVVDPGADAVDLRLQLARAGARCAAILVTHSHWDHIGGVAELAEGTGAPVYAPEGEADVLQRADEVYGALGVRVRPVDADVWLAGDESVHVAGIAFETLLVPGHSPGHLAFHADGALFSGDVLFAGGVGRTDLPGGDWDALVESIRMLGDRLPPDTVVYSGHGPPTTLGDELARNPFLGELRAAR
jgi:glyoxylase-like metal-dependent hydrolase (beta-lactamase superfamily II)